MILFEYCRATTSSTNRLPDTRRRKRRESKRTDGGEGCTVDSCRHAAFIIFFLAPGEQSRLGLVDARERYAGVESGGRGLVEVHP